jgi:hypothetical protein
MSEVDARKQRFSPAARPGSFVLARRQRPQDVKSRQLVADFSLLLNGSTGDDGESVVMGTKEEAADRSDEAIYYTSRREWTS